MDHIIVVKLKFKKRIHPSSFVRVFSFLRYPHAKIGFTFNYKAFLNAYGMTDIDISEMDELPSVEKIAHIVYGAALEYCRENKKKIFFDKSDIFEALQMASMKTNDAIGKAMSYARMPDWVQAIVDNLPKSKQDGIKKK